jgi:glutaminyl-tRNA synthetase
MNHRYGRLNMEGTVLSKRKIAKLVAEGHVKGWDDPRLYTLVGLRRRGIPPGAILAFVNELGVSTAVSRIQVARFENCVRRYLESTVPRLMLVLDPIPVVITNLPDDYLEEIECPFSPKNPEFGQHTLPFTNKVYIDRSDFKEEDSKDYFRLAPGKSVGFFKVPFPIRATGFRKDPSSGAIVEVQATYEKPAEGETMKKPKAYIQWVADSPKYSSPVCAEVRVLHSLIVDKEVRHLTSDDILLDGPKEPTPKAEERTEAPVPQPAAVPVSSDPAPSAPASKAKKVPTKAAPPLMTQILHPSSLVPYPNAVIEVGLHEIRRRAPWPAAEGEKNHATAGPETVRFQGMRVGYFALDGDTDLEGRGLVLNQIVSLKEDAGKA